MMVRGRKKIYYKDSDCGKIEIRPRRRRVWTFTKTFDPRCGFIFISPPTELTPKLKVHFSSTAVLLCCAYDTFTSEIKFTPCTYTYRAHCCVMPSNRRLFVYIIL